MQIVLWQQWNPPGCFRKITHFHQSKDLSTTAGDCLPVIRWLITLLFTQGRHLIKNSNVSNIKWCWRTAFWSQFCASPSRSFIVVRPTPSPASNDKRNNTARGLRCLQLISDSLTFAFICSFIQLISVVHLLHRKTILSHSNSLLEHLICVFHKRMSFLKAGTVACPETGWDVGPFAVVLAPGQMSPQATKYKEAINAWK